MCSFHSRSAYYSHTVHAPCWKGKKKSSRLPKDTGLFYQKFSQSNSNAGNSALTWTFGMTKKSPNILTKFVLSLRYRESSLTPNTYPHSLTLIQVTTGDVLAHLQGSKNTKTANSLDHKLTIIFWFHLSLYANTRHEHF